MGGVLATFCPVQCRHNQNNLTLQTSVCSVYNDIHTNKQPNSLYRDLALWNVDDWIIL